MGGRDPENSPQIPQGSHPKGEFETLQVGAQYTLQQEDASYSYLVSRLLLKLTYTSLIVQ